MTGTCRFDQEYINEPFSPFNFPISIQQYNNIYTYINIYSWSLNLKEYGFHHPIVEHFTWK